MKAGKSLCMWMGAIVAAWAALERPAQGVITFDPLGDSVVRVRFTPNIGAPGTFTEKTYKTVGGDFSFNGAVPTLPEFTMTNTAGTSTSASNASVDHNTSGANAGILWGAGTGVGQTDPTGTGSYGSNPSETKITIDLKWWIDDAWTSGSRTVFQLLPVKLTASAAGDKATVSGAFSYTLDLDSNGSIDKSALISYSEMLNGAAAPVSKTVYKASLLSATPIAAPGVGFHHLFRITGTLTFQALDPFDAGVDFLDVTDGLVQDRIISDLEAMFPGITNPMNPNGLDHNDFFAGGGSTDKQLPLTQNDPVFNIANPTVPEPSAAALLILAGLACLRRAAR
jgi:hypothetical protein